MVKYKLRFVIAVIILITLLFSTNVYAAGLEAVNNKELENLIINQLSLTNPDFNISYRGTLGDIDKVLKGILEKDPYLMCTITSVEWTSTGTATGGYNINIKASHIISAAERKEADKKIDSILAQIVNPYMTADEKVKAVHDYIILNGEYDTKMENYSDYDLLTKGKSVCNGYAILTYNMLKKLDIPVKLVFGASNSQYHVWNMVKLGDYWYHLDTTWDDPVPDKKNTVSYNYYLLTNEEILKDHTIDDNQVLPKAKYRYYDYLKEKSKSAGNGYIYEKLLAETGLDIYNEENTALTKDDLCSILKYKIKFHPTKISVRFDKSISKDNINDAMSALFEVREITEISYDQLFSDRTGKYNILNLYIKYKELPDSIVTDLSDKVYNIASKVNYNIYAVYGKNKINITNNALIYPYNKNFLKIYGNKIAFKDSGSQKLTIEYEGKKSEVNITAINSVGFNYITDIKTNNSVNVKIYDKYIDFKIINQWPFIEEGRTLVPIRAVFEVLNCNVSWDTKSSSAIVEHESTKIIIPANSKKAYVNGNEITLDVPARLVNDRIMVPLRFISEAINKTVIWDNTNSTVMIY